MPHKHLEVIHLPSLMQRTCGRPDVLLGLIDGPVAFSHPAFKSSALRLLGTTPTGPLRESLALLHGTAVASVLAARRDSGAPAICPDCTLLVRPIFEAARERLDGVPATTLTVLARAIVECVEAGARLLNLSVGLIQSSASGQQELLEALTYAQERGALLITAAGNQGSIGGSLLTRHPATLPVVACDLRGQPLDYSNLGASTGRRGISAPGSALPSVGLSSGLFLLSGTSAAAPLVTGTVALLWSLFPTASTAQLRYAVTGAWSSPRVRLVPPLLDAWRAYQILQQIIPTPQRRMFA
jgi:subtilisin family serine protease